ncbi:MAG: putative lipoprotein [Myxococcaceae bacterium]|nr:putative lipoprotein [Myxococcaceae bacterium]
MPRRTWLLLLLCGCPRPVPTPVEPRPPPPPAIRIPPGCELPLTGDWQHQDDPTFRYHFEDDRADVTGWVYRVFPPVGVDAGSPTRLFPRADAGAGKPAAGVRFPGVRLGGGKDAGAPDAGPPDAGPPDAGPPDAGPPDAGPVDTSHRHPLPPDLLPRDGGPPPLATAVIHLRRSPEGFVGETETLHLLPSGRECRATFVTRVTACTPSSLTLSSATSTPVGEGCQTPSLPQPAAMLEHRLARTDAGAL